MNTHCISLMVAFLSFFGAEFCFLVYKMHKIEIFIDNTKKTTIGHYLLE